jgi:hypothetical protein
MGRPLERSPRNSSCPGGEAGPDRHGLPRTLMDFCTIADRKVDGTCGRSPDGHLREAAVRVPGVTTMDTAVFIEKFTACRRLRANRRRSSPHLTWGARNTVGDRTWKGCVISASRVRQRSRRSRVRE